MSDMSYKLTKNRVMKRDGYVCQIRGRDCTGRATGCDHRAGRGSGGSKVLNRASNLIAACWNCNWQKETLHGEERDRLIERGVIVLKAATNERTAARALATPFVDVHGVTWWFDDDGGKETDDFREVSG